MSNLVERKVKIMVVDDLEIFCDHLNLYFGRRGYTVFTACSAEEALPVIKEQDPQVILLDINLPKMSGIGLLGLVRKFNKKLKVIMLSSDIDNYRDNLQVRQLDIFAFADKSIDFLELQSLIEKAVIKTY